MPPLRIKNSTEESPILLSLEKETDGDVRLEATREGSCGATLLRITSNGDIRLVVSITDTLGLETDNNDALCVSNDTVTRTDGVVLCEPKSPEDGPPSDTEKATIDLLRKLVAVWDYTARNVIEGRSSLARQAADLLTKYDSSEDSD